MQDVRPTIFNVLIVATSTGNSEMKLLLIVFKLFVTGFDLTGCNS